MILQTNRFDLVLMTAVFMQALLDGDVEAAAAEIGYKIPDDWDLDEWVLEIRLKKLLEDPNQAEWQLRAIVPKQSDTIIGHIGFHSGPVPEKLVEQPFIELELGYSVFNPHRRQYYAFEAAETMMNWAHADYGVQRFIVSIASDNVPSLGLARKLGFVYRESRVDPKHGPEEVLELVYEQ